MRVYKLILNIGLNANGVEQNESLTSMTVGRMFGNMEYRTEIAKGDWGEEKTMVFSINLSNLHLQPIERGISALCTKLAQDAIAFKIENEKGLIFNENYKGERYEFKEEYFINF